MTVLTRARAAGIVVTLDATGGVVVRGPRRIAALLDEVLLCADEVRAALRAEREGTPLPSALAAAPSSRPTGFLRLFRHGHRCRCGREFRCTAPSCAGQDILCVCCKLDDTERHAEWRSGE